MSAHAAFVQLPNVLTPRTKLSRRVNVCSRNGSSARVSPRSALGTTGSSYGGTTAAVRVAPKGPYCPLVDQSMLRHCLTCAKESKRSFNAKDVAVQRLLGEARAALREAQRGYAERLFLRALVVDPFYSRTYLLYALQVQRRDPVLARELFHQGVRANPGDAKLLQAWGLFESKQGKLARAQRLVRRSVALEPAHAPVLRWKLLDVVVDGRASEASEADADVGWPKWARMDREGGRARRPSWVIALL